MQVAIIIPWFGRDQKGGAEQQAWQLASRLAARKIRVDVLTTCSKAFLADWDENHFPQGTEEITPFFRLRRFPVSKRDRARFDRACQQLLALDRDELLPGVCPVAEEVAEDFCLQNIQSESLLEYVKRHAEDYDFFLFLPYLYGPILRGLPLVANKALLQPCLHDEAYAYLPQVEALFRSCARILFNSPGEFQLALTLYGPGIYPKSVVVGEGVEGFEQTESKATGLAASCRAKQYFLYAGRRDKTKNIHLVCRAFQRFQRQHASPVQLILIGPGNVSFADPDANILDLGLVSEEEKRSLLRHCLALVIPSEHESYSRVMMEAWLMARPVVVHKECLATSLAVQASGGGWIAASEEEWAACFAHLAEARPEEMEDKGQSGKAYAREFGDWDRVIDRYEQIFAELASPPAGQNKYENLAIHQVLPNLSYGDAISNHALKVRDYLRSQGAHSHIFVRYLHEKLLQEAEVFSSEKLNPGDVVLYHHSIGSEVTERICQYPGPKLLIYHNITPSRFFRQYSPVFVRLLEEGRNDLGGLAQHFPHAGGVSRYNCRELADVGFKDPVHLPLVLDPAVWNFPADPQVMQTMQDGRKNILFTGRISPNKCQHDLVAAMEWLVWLDPTVRLLLVGSYSPSDLYYQELQRQVAALGLSEWVEIPGHVSNQELHAYFRTAHLYWSMSEHEGFGVPLVEAMWFDVPVLAYKSSAVPETLADAGLLFTQKTDLAFVATLAHRVLEDEGLRQKIIAAQHKRRQELLPRYAYDALDRILQNMLEQS